MSDRPLRWGFVRTPDSFQGYPKWGRGTDGEWVRYSDYAALEAAGLEVAQDNDRLMGEIRKLEAERDEVKRMVEAATKDAADAIEQANAVRAERDRLRAVVMAAEWVCPKCVLPSGARRINGPEQETCRCGFDRAALEGGEDE